MGNPTFEDVVNEVRQDAMWKGNGFLQVTYHEGNFRYRRIPPLDVLLQNQKFEVRTDLYTIPKEMLPK